MRIVKYVFKYKIKTLKLNNLVMDLQLDVKEFYKIKIFVINIITLNV
jgi:hypothetical protein